MTSCGYRVASGLLVVVAAVQMYSTSHVCRVKADFRGSGGGDGSVTVGRGSSSRSNSSEADILGSVSETSHRTPTGSVPLLKAAILQSTSPCCGLPTMGYECLRRHH